MSSCNRRLSAALTGPIALVAMLAVSCAVTSPAQADDDSGGTTFSALKSTFLGFVGVHSEDDTPPIEYRERAPLVIPPKPDLPPPAKPIAKSTPEWPVDQVAARKKKQAEEARAAKSGDDSAMSPEEMQKKRDIAVQPVTPDSCPDQIMGHICNQEQFWNSLKVSKQEDQPLTPGQEPEREYLTQPPKGYMAAHKVMKPTFEAPKQEVDLSDARAQIREEARRKNSDE
jgi:hypothetical protein